MSDNITKHMSDSVIDLDDAALFRAVIPDNRPLTPFSIATPRFKQTIPWPDPTEDQLNSFWFNRIWEVIKTWDINVPEAYDGYCGATGNHVVAILNALNKDIEGKPKTYEHDND